MARIARRRMAIATAVTVFAGSLAACSNMTATPPEANPTASGEVAAEARTAVEAAYEGTARELPQSGPRAKEGSRVWLISCGQAFLGCSSVTNATMEAGETLKWEITLVDGKGDPRLFNDAIRQAVADGPDGIITVGMDCPLVRTSLEQAKSAGIPVIAPYSFDCDDPLAGGGEALFAGQINYGTDSVAEFFQSWGALQADYVAVKTEGTAKVVELNDPGYLFAQYRQKGFSGRLSEVCPSCEVCWPGRHGRQ